MAEYDARTDEALARLVSTLLTNAAQLLVGQLAGTEDAMQDLPSPSLRHARGIIPDDGDGDDEHAQTLEDPGPHHRPASITGCFRCTRTAVVGTWRRRDRSHTDVALQPASWIRVGAFGVR